MCLYPTLIKNPKYKANKKNRGQPPPILDKRVAYVPIGCQQCMECRKQKARSWQVRLLEDLKHHKNGKFITLTFSNEHYTKLSKEIPYTYTNKYNYEVELDGNERENAIATLAVRRFLERWRKKYKTSLRHWLVTELGHTGTENIHIHGIIWTNEPIQEVVTKWQYGYVWIGQNMWDKLVNYVNEQTVNYITKYVHKVDIDHKTYKSIILTSAGIGSHYTTRHDSKLNKYNGKKTNETYRTRSGHKIALPIYWRNKLYTEHEREQLWLHKLDKNERWICGERVDISENQNEYYKLLKWHQERNERMGYGTDKKDWTQQQYERERRNLLHQKRITSTSRFAETNLSERPTDVLSGVSPPHGEVFIPTDSGENRRIAHAVRDQSKQNENRTKEKRETIKIAHSLWIITTEGIKSQDYIERTLSRNNDT